MGARVRVTGIAATGNRKRKRPGILRYRARMERRLPPRGGGSRDDQMTYFDNCASAFISVSRLVATSSAVTFSLGNSVPKF